MKRQLLTDSEIEKLFFDNANVNARGFARAIEALIIEKIGEAVATREWNETKCKYDFCTDGNNEQPLYAIPFLEDE